MHLGNDILRSRPPLPLVSARQTHSIAALQEPLTTSSPTFLQKPPSFQWQSVVAFGIRNLCSLFSSRSVHRGRSTPHQYHIKRLTRTHSPFNTDNSNSNFPPGRGDMPAGIIMNVLHSVLRCIPWVKGVPPSQLGNSKSEEAELEDLELSLLQNVGDEHLDSLDPPLEECRGECCSVLQSPSQAASRNSRYFTPHNKGHLRKRIMIKAITKAAETARPQDAPEDESTFEDAVQHQQDPVQIPELEPVKRLRSIRNFDEELNEIADEISFQGPSRKSSAEIMYLTKRIPMDRNWLRYIPSRSSALRRSAIIMNSELNSDEDLVPPEWVFG
ncbi:hypothetical protein DFH27DRAFT_631617 [Peziza echinospora]|nr:hypothetical protein DFH27DRAFT_631617 [Peziza echinospora]